jgi:hypothetical protein
MEPLSFFERWDDYMFIGGAAFVALAFLILLYHEFRILQIKDYKEKYDYVNLHEIQFFWYGLMMLIFAGAFFGNTVGTERIIHRGMLFFWVRLFITLSGAFMVYFIFSSLVRIYYPRFVEKRLIKLRNKPRMSPSGNYMRKLSEEEEDVHLDASQIAEEASAVHSVDYDVWLDEKTGFKKIEKYLNYQHAEECPNCGYVTLKIDDEYLETPPTLTEGGVLAKHYKCGYCKHGELRRVALGKLTEEPAPAAPAK